MNNFIFIPEYKTIAKVQPTWNTEELLHQQGFYAADINFAEEHATPPLQAVLRNIPESYIKAGEEDGMEINIDVRVHELKRGDYPATPGWHCDAPLRETEFSSNGVRTPVLRSLIVNISNMKNGVSNTIFHTTPVTLPDSNMNYHTWQLMDDALRNSDDIEVTHDGELIEFSCYTPHSIQPATCDGTRMFVRISLWKKPEWFTPGITHSEQVYRIVKRDEQANSYNT